MQSKGLSSLYTDLLSLSSSPVAPSTGSQRSGRNVSGLGKISGSRCMLHACVATTVPGGNAKPIMSKPSSILDAVVEGTTRSRSDGAEPYTLRPVRPSQLPDHRGSAYLGLTFFDEGVQVWHFAERSEVRHNMAVRHVLLELGLETLHDVLATAQFPKEV